MAKLSTAVVAVVAIGLAGAFINGKAINPIVDKWSSIKTYEVSGRDSDGLWHLGKEVDLNVVFDMQGELLTRRMSTTNNTFRLTLSGSDATTVAREGGIADEFVDVAAKDYKNGYCPIVSTVRYTHWTKKAEFPEEMIKEFVAPDYAMDIIPSGDRVYTTQLGSNCTPVKIMLISSMPDKIAVIFGGKTKFVSIMERDSIHNLLATFLMESRWYQWTNSQDT